MRTWLYLLSFIWVLSCDQFPTNPIQTPEVLKKASVACVESEYVPVNPPGEGLVATKVNVLAFRVRAMNFHAKAIELIGRATFEGLPGNSAHTFRFRTDSIGSAAPKTVYPFDVIRSIEPETTYTFFRFQFPMNEYSPFSGTLGKIRSVTIDEIFAYDEDSSHPTVVVNTTEN